MAMERPWLFLDDSAAIACLGDCRKAPRVGSGPTIDELLVGVNIALGNLSLGQCTAFVADRADRVQINDLIAGVGNALTGCGL